MQYYILYNIVSAHTIQDIILFVNTYISIFFSNMSYCTAEHFSGKIFNSSAQVLAPAAK